MATEYFSLAKSLAVVRAEESGCDADTPESSKGACDGVRCGSSNRLCDDCGFCTGCCQCTA